MRLGRTKDLGAEIINFDDEDPADFIKKETAGKGVICIDAVGYESVGHMAGNVSVMEGNNLQIKGSDKSSTKNHDHSKFNIPAYQPLNPVQVITWMSQVAKKYSTISIPGVYATAYDQFPLGLLFNRNVSIHMGQCPVKKYSEQLFHLIETKRNDPTKVISHTMNLDDAPKGYADFDKKEEVMKIVLKPQG
jgi:S-(hydroxymethyl)glutathione dehydrogenase/alcohol dehydrogenase